MRTTTTITTAFVCFAVLSVACGAGTSTEAASEHEVKGAGPTTTEAAPATPAASTPPTGALPAPGGGANPAPAPTGGACSAEATWEACGRCCEAKTPGYEQTVAQLAQKHLACTCEPARCGAVCGEAYCSGKDDDGEITDACADCLFDDAKVGACDDADTAAWDANPVTVAYDACHTASACFDKPSAFGDDDDDDAKE